MYRPPAFAADDDQAFALIVAHPLAQLVVSTPDGLAATPVPLVRRGEALVGHLARANPVWRHPGDALALFTAADAYVSPRWYETKPIDGKVVSDVADDVADVAGWITHRPGGVGPMTRAMLLSNIVSIAEKSLAPKSLG